MEQHQICGLMDMNYDCLWTCLRQLSIPELLNVANCNQQLRYIARHLIARQFAGKLELRGLEDKWVRIHDFKFNLQFLRCCGDLVSKIRISIRKYGQPTPIQYGLIADYINEYCHEFLKKFYFFYCPQDSLKGLTKPFIKVEKITIDNSFGTVTRISELFPNLRELIFKCDHCTTKYLTFPSEFFSDHYPFLEHVSIELPDGRNKWQNFFENVATFLHSNPQLKSLDGNVWFDVIFSTKNFSHPSERLKNVEKLTLTRIHCKGTMEEKLNLKNLKELFFRIDPYDPEDNGIVPFTSDKLESLKIDVFDEGYEDDDDDDTYVRKVISNCPSVKKLTLISGQINHMELSKQLPLLEEIDFFDCVDLSLEEAVRFVHQFDSLKVFRFRSLPNLSLTQLMTRLGKGWLLSSSKVYPYFHKFILVRVERCTETS